MVERAGIMKGSRVRHIRGWRFSEFMLPVLVVMFNRAHVRRYSPGVGMPLFVTGHVPLF